MEVSEELSTAMDTLQSHEPDILTGWKEEEHLAAPYLLLYHAQPLLTRLSDNLLNSTKKEHVQTLTRYLESLKPDYEQAEALFAKGIVSRSQFHKLFKPGELVLTRLDNEPVAIQTTGCPIAYKDPLTTTVIGYRWAFTGRFQRQITTHFVAWPADSKHKAEVPITSLSAYPLKYDKTGTADRLKERGETFWKCRRRQFVSYEAPRQTIDLQTVRTSG